MPTSTSADNSRPRCGKRMKRGSIRPAYGSASWRAATRKDNRARCSCWRMRTSIPAFARNLMTTQAPTTRTSEAAIFGRLIRADNGDLPHELARYILTIGFDSQDQARMRDLAARNQEGLLSPEEKEELQGYVKAGHLLALLHSKARKSLKRNKVS